MFVSDNDDFISAAPYIHNSDPRRIGLIAADGDAKDFQWILEFFFESNPDCS